MPNKTHGMANNRVTGYKNRAYGIWQAMKDRCTNKNRADYKYYGEKGIVVCSEWANSFETFLADMGEPAEGMTLDRIDSNKGYCKNNCKWSTRKEQSRANSNVRKITIGDTEKLLVDWLKEFNIPKPTFYWRLTNGWSELEALNVISRVKK
jgi:hypothetical protein